ncbi:MAG: DUF4410 domain-containing protein [Bacteroidetes bacterium]|jgi:hypothetical protein|nr:DUF4410 domain-containing protein [Bacteroidota bacterium]MBT3750167.1 DUF4410 domain-containing protein [Bacteroidota bacterium]MBT4399622.1 DUF4410 domain-containing protein [Bacteroidota bacterium]MBT4409744.1 DUF4410 domain-containing protein [Bacteroidota bacterium]MBT7093920.1 DUF4410 domain-containing protein [Bacteroidota bacterium]
MKPKFFASAIIFLVIIITSCTPASYLQTVNKPISASLASYRVAIVDVIHPEGDPANLEERQLLAREISIGLEQDGPFIQIIHADSEEKDSGDILIECLITRIKRMSREARIMLGIMAGPASIEIQVKLIEQKSKKVIGEATVTGKSSAGTIASGTTEEAIQEAAKGVVKFVIANK